MTRPKWFSLPAGNIRVRDVKVRALLEQIENAFRVNIGAVPTRTEIIEAALQRYADNLKSLAPKQWRHYDL